jgi:anaerobic selenocysteine-containing dehydrogenase
MAKSKTGSVNRRGFLKSARVTAAALVANPAPPASAAAKAPQEPPRNATGKKLYTNYYCYACHGTEGQGGRDGARIAPTASEVFSRVLDRFSVCPGQANTAAVVPRGRREIQAMVA